MEVKKPAECRTGEQLGEDLFIRGNFYPAGTVLTSFMIQDLRRSRIKTLRVITPENQSSHQDPSTHEVLDSAENTNGQLAGLFPSLIDNKRYGHALHRFQDVQWLEKLYSTLLEYPGVSERLEQLKHWNPYSYLHSIDVFVLGTLLAKQKSMENIESFALGCLMHDIGKLKVPKHLLEKEGKLTAAEYDLIKTHTIKGEELLKEDGYSLDVQRMARSHHERLDKSGYPDQSDAVSFDLPLKIIMIADVYSALTLNRSYRKPLNGAKAMEILLKDGSKYDLDLCHAFITMLDLYPDFTEVLLSDGRTGTIIYKKSGEAFHPFVKLEDEDIEYSLESHEKPAIQSIVGWKSVQLKRLLKKNWYSLLVYLTEGKKLPAIKLIDQFSDDMRIESIYMDLLEQIYIEIEGAAREKRIDTVDEHIAYTTLLEILNYKMIENTASLPNFSGSTVLAGFESPASALPLKMIDDLLTINGWQTFYLGQITCPSLLIECIKKYNLNYVTLFAGSASTVPLIQSTIKALRTAMPSITILLNGPFAYHMNNLPQDVIQTYGLRDYLSKLKHYMNAS